MRRLTPTILHNFLRWLLCGPKCTDVPSPEEQIKLRDVPSQRRVLSIAQDIIFFVLQKPGQVKTQKHVALITVVKNITGSAKVVTMLTLASLVILYLIAS